MLAQSAAKTEHSRRACDMVSSGASTHIWPPGCAMPAWPCCQMISQLARHHRDSTEILLEMVSRCAGLVRRAHVQQVGSNRR
jgi:hypothetical protein